MRIRCPQVMLMMALLVSGSATPPASRPIVALELPAQLTDLEFWKLATELSEPTGTFHSENLVSNESRFQTILSKLRNVAAPGRAYVGVGSEQNFTYIAALRPAVAFIVDIRRGNFDLHLIYKALFELSANRADFLSRMFSRRLPPAVNASSTVVDLFASLRKASPDRALYERNLREIKTHLAVRHGFKLLKEDQNGIDFVYSAWFESGPDIQYELMGGGPGTRSSLSGAFPTYEDLMTATDGTGRHASFLGSESLFKVVKDLQTRNLVIPIVGNFAGPKALRSVAAYLKQRQTMVSAFYVSNVEQYLREDGLWERFCMNAAALPVDGTSTFIRSQRGGFRGRRTIVGIGFDLELVPMRDDLATCSRR